MDSKRRVQKVKKVVFGICMAALALMATQYVEVNVHDNVAYANQGK